MKHRINIYYTSGRIFKFEGEDISDISMSACARLLGMDLKNVTIYINKRYFLIYYTADVGLIRKDMIEFMEKMERPKLINFNIDHLFEV